MNSAETGSVMLKENAAQKVRIAHLSARVASLEEALWEILIGLDVKGGGMYRSELYKIAFEALHSSVQNGPKP